MKLAGHLFFLSVLTGIDAAFDPKSYREDETIPIPNKPCNSDSDCVEGAACLTVDIGRHKFKKCTPLPVCKGNESGHCPSQDNVFGPLICGITPTDKLRNVVCCNGMIFNEKPKRRLQSDTSDVSGEETVETGDENVNTGDGTVSNNVEGCFECFFDPEASPTRAHPEVPVVIAGFYECIPKDDCEDLSAFADVCQVGETCSTDGGNLCNGVGTCSPVDPDDPATNHACRCNAGYDGPFCETVEDNSCLVDCGPDPERATCVKESCKCAKGYTGKQCLDCASDDVCSGSQSTGTCDISTGKCECVGGFEGDSFCKSPDNGIENICDNVVCGDKGTCSSGMCVCTNECKGGSCKACTDALCADCNGASSGLTTTGLVLIVNSIVTMMLSII